MIIRISTRDVDDRTSWPIRTDHEHGPLGVLGRTADHSHGGYGERPAFGPHHHYHFQRTTVPSEAPRPPRRWDYDLDLEITA